MDANEKGPRFNVDYSEIEAAVKSVGLALPEWMEVVTAPVFGINKETGRLILSSEDEPKDTDNLEVLKIEVIVRKKIAPSEDVKSFIRLALEEAVKEKINYIFQLNEFAFDEKDSLLIVRGYQRSE